MSNVKSLLSKSFVDNHADVTEDVAADLIVRAEQKIKTLKEEKAADEKLTHAKQIVKDLNKGYSAASQYERAKIEYLLEKIQEIQGGEVNPSSGANA